MEHSPYESPRLTPLGTIFEPVERRGEEFAVRLAEGFFALPAELREKVLSLLMERTRAGDSACKEPVLYNVSDGRRIGTFSPQTGLKGSGP